MFWDLSVTPDGKYYIFLKKGTKVKMVEVTKEVAEDISKTIDIEIEKLPF